MIDITFSIDKIIIGEYVEDLLSLLIFRLNVKKNILFAFKLILQV